MISDAVTPMLIFVCLPIFPCFFPDTADAADFDPGDEPLIYVTLGSSGNPLLLSKIVPVLERTGCRGVMTTAGKPVSFKPVSSSTCVFDYLPGDVVCRKARLVVCSGGSPTTNQALAKGVPALGIAQNMDQFLNMQAVEAFGAGLLVRADQVDFAVLSSAVAALMSRRSFRDRACELAASVAADDGAAILARHLRRLARCSKPARVLCACGGAEAAS